MTSLEQLNEWVKGNSIHNTESGECCPDFSCCNSDVNTDIETRKMFRKAYIERNEELVIAILSGFLGEATSGYITEKKRTI